ncbi:MULTISPECIES: hypothetical protein [Kordiimonas]|jgi:hypothetical protein|uniref:hypothetical protein n=1 Tax=Kordiimonas TaxID=288021 RepID=UPI00257BA7F6|nr:hypothetical protein [Kordiimonas sp. UBA4487]
MDRALEHREEKAVTGASDLIRALAVQAARDYFKASPSAHSLDNPDLHDSTERSSSGEE